jgi:Tol biopolymer transport system component
MFSRIMTSAIAASCLLTSVLPAIAACQDPTPGIFAPGVISGPANDLSPAFTPDGKTVFFTRSNANVSVILVSHWSHGRWSMPEIAPFSGEWRDLEPTMAPDGSYLVFASNRPATPGGKALDAFYGGAAQPTKGGNLWRVDRTPTGWSAPRRLPDVINSNSSIFSPSIAADGSLYFMQPTGSKTEFHLFRAQYTNGTYEAPVAVPVSAGEEYGDYDPAVAPDESFMVFSSSRPPSKSTSLFIAFRKNGTWETPIFMGNVVNLPGTGDIEARLSPDHRTVYFSSNRLVPAPMPRARAETVQTLARIATWDNGLLNIWQVSLDPWLAQRTVER